MTIDPSFPRAGIQRGGWSIPAGAPWSSRRDEASLISPASFCQPDYLVDSAWLEHAPFLSWLIETHAPRRFVELGCHNGYSYFVACQAVRRLSLGTECFAVDTWQGDEHAGFYDEAVFKGVDAHNAAHYSAFSHLVRSTFSDASTVFADGSIDLLHVDGRHFYEDVLEDVSAWRPKLSEDAIVLLHDTTVRERKFGVWKLFDELRQSYPTFEFLHGHGLGVVAFGRVPEALESLFNLSPEKSGFLRLAYATLGRAITERWVSSRSAAESARREGNQRTEVEALSTARKREKESFEQELAAGRTRIADLEAESSSRLGDIAALSASRDAETGALEQKLAIALTQIADLESLSDSTVSEIHIQALSHQGEMALLEGELTNARAELRAHVGEVDQLRSELKSSIEAGAESERALGQSRDTHERSKALLWTHHSTIRRMTAAEREAGTALAAARGEISALAREQSDLRRSASWKLTEPLRTLYRRRPYTMRRAYAAARFGWFLAGLKFGDIAERFRARAQLRRDEALLEGDAMFDAAYYAELVPDVDRSGFSRARHYLVRGRFAFLSPHPLFDARWYAEEYGDIGTEDPLTHYIRLGRGLGRKPNALFDPDWYSRKYLEANPANLDPLAHFCAEGAMKRLNPSPDFNTAFYLSQNPDIADLGVNPLAHYLRYGRFEGRECKGYEVDSSMASPVTAAPIECRKKPSFHSEVALFVTHSPNGRLKPHVRHYLEALAREGIAITLIIAADRGFSEDEPSLLDLLDGLYVRSNEGWDFAAWAHVLRLNRHLFGAQILYWLNDSLIGPVNGSDFHALLARVRRNPADLVGLTANYERGYHLQSYFLALKRPVLQSGVFQAFVQSIKSFSDKDDAINSYEIRLSPKLSQAGLTIAAVFEPPGEHNPTIYNWKALLEQGFAFLKVTAITNDIRHVDKSDWRETLDARGYDVILADQLLAERRNPPMGRAGPMGWRPAPPLRNDPPHLAFIAPFNYANGLGVAARGYLSAMMHTGWLVNALPIARPFYVHRRVAPSLRSIEFTGAPDVTIVHLNPDAWEGLLDSSRLEAVDAAHYRVGAFVWESDHLPPGFADTIRELSTIWAPSRYCAAAFEKVAGIPVHVVPYPVPVRPRLTDPRRMEQAKTEIGLAAEHKVALYSFDASSYLARKNPLALIRAFDQSGLAGKGWRLVLKTKHLGIAGDDGIALAAAAERSGGTILVDRVMRGEAAHALMDAADIYVSPHAAEGFGLTIAEAMAQGKPVIATDYSGSTDFLDSSCGFPVSCDPWQLDRDIGPYLRGTNWAKVNEDALAETLITVATLDPAERAAVGGRARRRIEAQLSPATVAVQMRRGIESLIGP